MTYARLMVGAALAAAAVGGTARLSAGALPGGRRRWERTNHAGRQVSLVEGPALLLGCAVAGLGLPAVGLAGVASGALGAADDLVGTTARKGLRGHLRALTRGEFTTGALKIAGLPVVGALTAYGLDGPARRVGIGTVLGAGVVAGTANLVNLFDLRPGRALKVTLLLAAPLVPRGDLAEGALVGTCLAALPEDLAGRQMMGDTGANALGAVLGALLLTRLGTPGRGAVLASLVALTLASERISFSQVIATHPLLRRADEWGRAGT